MTNFNAINLIEGCADDFGLWNDPDPYIFMMVSWKQSSKIKFCLL